MEERNSKIRIILSILFILVSAGALILIINLGIRFRVNEDIFTIKIYNKEDWENLVASKSWCKGSGTVNDPYIIENLNINARQEWVDCVFIQNSEAYFIIRNCSFFDSSCCYPHWCLCGIRHGMRLINVTNGIIMSNQIYLNDYGIRLDSCSNISIVDNYIYNNLVNLMIQNSNNNTISDNIFSNYYYGRYGGSGLLLDNSYYNKITNNHFNASGIHFGDSLLISSNSIGCTNLINGKPIYVYLNEQNLESENFTDPGQIILYNCSKILIKAFNFTEIVYPVYLTHCSNFEISNNSFCRYDKRIYLNECNNGSIINNSATDNPNFLTIINSTQIEISNNTLINNCEPITIQNSENITISFNTITISCYCSAYDYYYYPVPNTAIYLKDTNSSFIIFISIVLLRQRK